MSTYRAVKQHELRSLFLQRGCPVDAEKKLPLPQSLLMTPLSIHETTIFDMWCGGTGCVLNVSIANQHSEPITICGFALAMPPGFPEINWLEYFSEQLPPPKLYRLPNGLEYPRNLVLNHRTYKAGVLRSGQCLEGLLLGWAGEKMSDRFCHGDFIEAELTVSDQLRTEHSCQLKLWLDRTERGRSLPKSRGEGLFGSGSGKVSPSFDDLERLTQSKDLEAERVQSPEGS
ncbi:MAG: hypothetical protein M3O09_18975 [Acidobacteriota bacterium]|nr:hypothetical protein [Acidobacteriota bacterium]